MKNITWNELLVPLGDVDSKRLLVAWRWLVNDTYTPIAVTTLGHMFLETNDGRIHWLNTASGTITPVALSYEEFKSRMIEPNNYDEWFVPDLVLDIMELRGGLPQGQCYSPIVPPIIGGAIDPSNFESTELIAHFTFLGGVHEKARQLPQGTRVTGLNIEWIG